jgi:hypothetical protein
LVAVKLKVWLLVAPWLSVAVTVMLYNPSLPGPPWLASGSSVPVIRPLSGSIDKPVGRPVALIAEHVVAVEIGKAAAGGDGDDGAVGLGEVAQHGADRRQVIGAGEGDL